MPILPRNRGTYVVSLCRRPISWYPLITVTPTLLCLFHEVCKVIPWNLLFIFAPSSGVQSVSEYHTILFIGDRAQNDIYPDQGARGFAECLQCYITDLSARAILFARHRFVSILGVVGHATRSFTTGWCLCVQFLPVSFMNRRHVSLFVARIRCGILQGGSRLALSLEKIQPSDLLTNSVFFVWRVYQLLSLGLADPEFIWFLFIREGDVIHAFHSFMTVHV